jgi:hypothetical protein
MLYQQFSEIQIVSIRQTYRLLAWKENFEYSSYISRRESGLVHHSSCKSQHYRDTLTLGPFPEDTEIIVINTCEAI